MTTNKLMREQFEETFSKRGFSVEREESRGWYYVDLMTEGAWRGWQAALEHPYKHTAYCTGITNNTDKSVWMGGEEIKAGETREYPTKT